MFMHETQLELPLYHIQKWITNLLCLVGYQEHFEIQINTLKYQIQILVPWMYLNTNTSKNI